MRAYWDVIEHLERAEADRVLDRLERAYRMVVVFTPWGFLRQDPTTDPRLADDPWMWHRCGFLPRDFDRRGYLTFGWPLYHPGAQVGAILAIKCEPARRDRIESAVLDAYRELRRGASLTRAIGRWWKWKLKRYRYP